MATSKKIAVPLSLSLNTYIFAIFNNKLYSTSLSYKEGFLLYHEPMGSGDIPIEKSGSAAQKGYENTAVGRSGELVRLVASDFT